MLAHSKYLRCEWPCYYPPGTPGRLPFYTSGLVPGALSGEPQVLALQGLSVLVLAEALAEALSLPLLDSRKLLPFGAGWDSAWLEFARRFPIGAKKLKMGVVGKQSLGHQI